MFRPFIKKALLHTRAGNYVYGQAQEGLFEYKYRHRREHYQRLVASNPDAYRVDAHIARARAKIAGRGYVPRCRPEGDIHTFAYVPSNWPHQNHIAAALRPLGPVTRFDYAARGIPLAEIRTCSPDHRGLRERLYDELLEEMRRAHHERPLDWFFSYALGWDMTAELGRRIHDEFGAPMVNISLDDKNWWGDIERGAKFLSPLMVSPRSISPHQFLSSSEMLTIGTPNSSWILRTNSAVMSHPRA
jgi:hypothetical protein